MEEETMYCLDLLQFLAHTKEANASAGSNSVFLHETRCFAIR